jgi:hypothetical protein
MPECGYEGGFFDVSPLEKYLIGVSVPFALRFGMYYGVFKFRAIKCSGISYFVIAGGFMLAGLVSAVPLLYFVSAFGVPIFLMMKYTDAEPAPAVVITIIVELVAYMVTDYLISPLIS